MEQLFLSKLREVLDAEDKEIQLTDKFRDYDEWNSLANLSLIAMIDEEYGIVIPPEEFRGITTVGALIDEVKRRKLANA